MLMTVEETIGQLAYDWMKDRCPQVYLVIDTQVKAGKGKDAILTFCLRIRGANEFFLSQVEGTINHLRREQEA
jgi:hypothetical protein